MCARFQNCSLVMNPKGEEWGRGGGRVGGGGGGARAGMGRGSVNQLSPVLITAYDVTEEAFPICL